MLTFINYSQIIGKGETFPGLFLENILLLVLAIPLLSILVIFFLGKANTSTYYIFSLYSTMFSFLISLILLYTYDATIGGFQFTYVFNITPTLPYGLRFGVDGISIFFLLLTNIFIYLCILSLNKYTHRLKEVLLHLLFLQ